MKKLSFLIFLVFISISCIKAGVNGGPCYAKDITFKETKVNNLTSSNSLIVTLDVKNNAKSDYDVTKSGLGNSVYYKMTTKTTDGTLYETKNIFLGSISGGATTSHNVLGSYGAGKTFDSYSLSLYCQ
jgi:hypothetical protein